VDFDGTLAPIVVDYQSAQPLPEAASLLRRLAGRYARVAVISGRPLAYLAEHLPGAGGTELIGLYGLERSGRPPTPAVEKWRAAAATVARVARAEAPDGVVIESKGLAVTLHYRTAPEHQVWVERFAGGQAAQTGLVAHPGKMSVELRPDVRTDKGTVVAELSENLDAVCFIGDDRGDLPAFAVLERLRAGGVETLAVAVDGPETPTDLKSAADLVVDGPGAVMDLLSRL
jgi:trehalose 6-phosphate phosphatase